MLLKIALHDHSTRGGSGEGNLPGRDTSFLDPAVTKALTLVDLKMQTFTEYFDLCAKLKITDAPEIIAEALEKFKLTHLDKIRELSPEDKSNVDRVLELFREREKIGPVTEAEEIEFMSDTEGPAAQKLNQHKQIDDLQDELYKSSPAAKFASDLCLATNELMRKNEAVRSLKDGNVSRFLELYPHLIVEDFYSRYNNTENYVFSAFSVNLVMPEDKFKQFVSEIALGVHYRSTPLNAAIAGEKLDETIRHEEMHNLMERFLLDQSPVQLLNNIDSRLKSSIKQYTSRMPSEIREMLLASEDQKQSEARKMLLGLRAKDLLNYSKDELLAEAENVLTKKPETLNMMEYLLNVSDHANRYSTATNDMHGAISVLNRMSRNSEDGELKAHYQKLAQEFPIEFKNTVIIMRELAFSGQQLGQQYERQVYVAFAAFDPANYREIESLVFSNVEKDVIKALKVIHEALDKPDPSVNIEFLSSLTTVAHKLHSQPREVALQILGDTYPGYFDLISAGKFEKALELRQKSIEAGRAFEIDTSKFLEKIVSRMIAIKLQYAVTSNLDHLNPARFEEYFAKLSDRERKSGILAIKDYFSSEFFQNDLLDREPPMTTTEFNASTLPNFLQHFGLSPDPEQYLGNN